MKLTFPESLPVSRQREDIRDAMAHHQVVIVCGDTGSGKTTQLPKIAMEMGRGLEGKRIGCTQPRRIAATSVARRVADEMQVTLGKEVGYQIRFEDRTERGTTAVKFMTDGVLLAETRNDPNLLQYDTLIIDEAHERSLNIDFILGYLHRTLQRRKDLKVVISSATLDAGSFSEFFRGAPVIEVEGRVFPVKDVYQEPIHERERLAEQVARAVEDLGKFDPLGDTLVFLPGEREIRDAADLLEGRKLRECMILPLFARLAGKAQQAVFNPVRSRRRVILATNVAETSLTIPGIRFVVDSGLARISRHDPASGIQRLQIEAISKASARQRRGRCGRVSEGVCVRLYGEEDFDARQEYTTPEILRSNLAGVVLQMEHLGLGDPLKFPFVDRPQPKRVAQAYRVLDEIGAIHKPDKRAKHDGLTKIGHTMARLPLDPRVGRILVAAREEKCLLEALIVASAITVQDPRERPKEKQQAADSAHAQFRDKRSDFTGWLRLWFAIDKARATSNNHLRRFCQKNFINFRRVQEWRNLHRELRDTLRQMKWKVPPPGKKLSDPEDTYSEPLHRAILAAIPSQIGLSQGKKVGYQGARDSTFFLFPGSGIFKSSPPWVMAFEMVETARLYARNAAMLDPAWFEKVAPHLCRHRYSNPHWVNEQGAVYGDESVFAFGLPVVERRPIHYARIDRKVAREVFLREALVNLNTRAPIPALEHNRETLDAAERLEHKMRRVGGLLYPEAVVDFYEERLPEHICTQKDFERWVTREPAGTIDLCLQDCLLPQLEPIRVEDYPDTLPSPDGGTELYLHYWHHPTDPADGVHLEIPLAELPHLPTWFGDWLVAGWLPEKVGALLRCLSKDIRMLLPANREVAEDFVHAWHGYEPNISLVEALLDYVSESHGVDLRPESFDLDRLPLYLQMQYTVLNDAGKVVGTGRDLAALQESLASHVKERFSTVSRGRFEKKNIGSWSFGDLPDEVQLDRLTVGYPGLHDEGSPLVSMKLWPSPECAAVQHRLGLAKLYRTTHPEPVERLQAVLFSAPAEAPPPPMAKPVPRPSNKKGGAHFGSMAAAFGASPPPSLRKTPTPEPKRKAKPVRTTFHFLTPDEAWLLSQIGPEPERNRDDLVRRIVGNSLGETRDKSTWEKATTRLDDILFEEASEVCDAVSKILSAAETVSRLMMTDKPGFEESISDAREHLEKLFAPGWLLQGPLNQRLLHLQGLEMRLTRMLGAPPAKDLQKLARYEEAAAEIWRQEEPCDCGRCPVAIAKAEYLAEDFSHRLKIFAPELRARMRREAPRKIS